MELQITFQQGGMREFERTGIYPEYLLFNLPGTKQSWRIRIKEKPQEGVLKSNGRIVYHYCFDGDVCKTRIVKEDGSLSNWKEPEVIIFEMRD
ncbi:hypothetical protein BC962_2052 [Gillisia mitskevichiae]|uniref:Uncharacterized protein n=1 Tax=Gillisia mitskevichiae TaxID=270921 RepID=A0A495PVJ8_9FLAO|nr:hypothetical protein [Gillisia mitskevichiae]RKS53795.1 hypothetical protein BC962_2052 [Gillisia mitskevichiae]